MNEYNEAVQIRKQFEKEFMFSAPFDSYINGCSLQSVADRMPEKLCLYVLLIKPLPQGMELPSNYKGIPVVSRVYGNLEDEEIYED